EQFQGDFRFGQGPTLGLWHAGLVQAVLVGQPDLGQVQAQVEGVVALGADVVDTDGDLTVGLLAQGAAVLALDADGALALLGEGDVVEEEDGLRAGESLGQEGAVAAQDGLVVPGALVDELLQGLVFVLDAGQPFGQRDAAGQRLAGLSLPPRGPTPGGTPRPPARAR